MGAGVASFSHFGGVHFQNVDGFDDYVSMLERGQLPLGRAFPTTSHQRLIRELILQMKLGRVEVGYFEEKFGANILERFAGQLDELTEEGLLDVMDGSIVLSRDGLLCVDNLLHYFFLEHHKTDRLV